MRRMKPSFPSLALVAAAVALWNSGAARAQNLYDAIINTPGLLGTNGQLAFDLIGGDSASPNNTVLITDFVTNGSLLGLTNTNTGGASGDLPGTLTLTDSAFFNESARGITFGSSLAFTIDLTQNFAGGSFDQLSFFLLDAAGANSLVTTNDPTGANALFVLDITGQTGGALTVFAPSAPTAVSYAVGQRPAQAVIPEPGTGALLASGLLSLAGGVGVFRRRKLRAD